MASSPFAQSSPRSWRIEGFLIFNRRFQVNPSQVNPQTIAIENQTKAGGDVLSPTDE